MKTKQVVATLGAIAVASTLSGCITQTGFHWSNDGPKAGDTVKGTVDLKGLNQSSPKTRGPVPTADKAYYYLVLNGKGEGFSFSGFKFDPAKVLGPKVKMVEDSDVSDFGSGECAPTSGGTAYRTKVPVKETPKDKVFDAIFKAKLSNMGGAFEGFVSSGQWYDDGDGVAEDPSMSDDTYACSGVTSTALTSKGFFDN